MKPQSAIQKGKELENWIVERLRLSGLDKRAARNPGSGSGKNKGDIWNDLNLCIEAKNTARISVRNARLQAIREAQGTQTPIVVWHPPKTPLSDSLVILDWYYLEELLLKSKEPNLTNPDRQFRWKLERLKHVAHEVLKEL